MTTILSLLIAVCLFLFLHSLLRGLFYHREQVNLRMQFVKNELTQVTLHAMMRKNNVKEQMGQILKSLAGFLVRFTPDTLKQEFELKIQKAGRPYGFRALDWIVLMLCSAVFLPVLTIFLLFDLVPVKSWILLSLVEVLFGLGIPKFMLAKAQKQRMEKILEDLPSTLDLLTICVEAGATLDGAMTKVVEKMEGPIAEEFDTVLKTIQLGESRIAAFKALAERIPLDDMLAFTRAMIQAEKTGSRIGNILKLISEDMRENKRMRLKGKIGKAIIKILIPIVVFIMPTTAIIVMGPIALKMYKIFMTTKFY